MEDTIKAKDIGAGGVAGSGSVDADKIAGRDVNDVHQVNVVNVGNDSASPPSGTGPLNDPRVREVFRRLADIDNNGGFDEDAITHLRADFPELDTEILGVMLTKMDRRQRRTHDEIEAIRRDIADLRRAVTARRPAWQLFLMTLWPVLVSVIIGILLHVQ